MFSSKTFIVSGLTLRQKNYTRKKDPKCAAFSPLEALLQPLVGLVTEAEDIKKRWQEYTEELYKKELHNQDNHDGVITHLEPDILECEVKWALGSLTMNKASRGDRIPVELFQILKDDAVKVLHSICQQIWKTQQWSQDWKRSVFIPIQRMFKLLHN